MRARGLIKALFPLVLAACAVARGGEDVLSDVQGLAGQTGWRCADGSSFLASFDPVLNEAVLDQDGNRQTLSQVPAASGARYQGGAGYDFWIDGNQAMLTQPGGVRRSCTRSF